MPAFIEALCEERLRGQGFGLRGLAVLAATLLDLVTSETHDDLQTVYAYNAQDLSELASSASVNRLVNDYVIVQFHTAEAASNQSMNLRVMQASMRRIPVSRA